MRVISSLDWDISPITLAGSIVGVDGGSDLGVCGGVGAGGGVGIVGTGGGIDGVGVGIGVGLGDGVGFVVVPRLQTKLLKIIAIMMPMMIVMVYKQPFITTVLL